MIPQFAVALMLSVGLGADHKQPGKEPHDGPLPHPHDPVLQAEHLAMLDLVPRSDATHAAGQDGRWSDPATWKNGQVPSAGAKVVIPRGRTVTVADIQKTPVQTVRVDGTLRFEPTKNTALAVDTLVVTPSGHLIIGTAEEPVAADKRARLIFTGQGPIDTDWDAHLLSRGMISHGAVTMHGVKKRPYVALARPAKRGDGRLVLTEKPVNWKTGDRLILIGTNLSRNEDEDLTVIAISGTEVKVRPLAYDHMIPVDGISVYVANVSRNIVLESQKPSPVTSRGHVMFMHSPHAVVESVGFYNLGRSDKLKPVNDPKVDHQQRLVAGSGQNPRGRYSVHFHRTGTGPQEKPAVVRGCAVVNSPGWGFVNHSSHVLMEDNVAVNVSGAAFVTEAGDEIGAFRRNLAIRSNGTGQGSDARRPLQDFGHEGDGFWFQGGGVVVEDNIAAGHSGNGFIFYTKGLDQEGLGITRFSATNLHDRSLGKGKSTVDVRDVPIRSFKRNIALTSGMGFMVQFHVPGGGRHSPNRSVLEDGIVWNCKSGARVQYAHRVTFRNLRLIGNPERPNFTAILGVPEDISGMRYENLHVEGWAIGIRLSLEGDHVIEGGYYNNVRNFLIPHLISATRQVDITGDVQFGTLSSAALGGRTQEDIVMDPDYRSVFERGARGNRGPNTFFLPDVVRLDTPKLKGQQVYFLEQAAQAVPFKKETSSERDLPVELIGLTNQEMSDRYGLAFGGALAPADAGSEPRIHGLVGRRSTYRPSLLLNQVQTSQLARYSIPAYEAGAKPHRIMTEPANLHEGWNLVTRRIDGQVRSFLIFGGDLPRQPTAQRYQR
jgi:hypothetical protein